MQSHTGVIISESTYILFILCFSNILLWMWSHLFLIHTHTYTLYHLYTTMCLNDTKTYTGTHTHYIACLYFTDTLFYHVGFIHTYTLHSDSHTHQLCVWFTGIYTSITLIQKHNLFIYVSYILSYIYIYTYTHINTNTLYYRVSDLYAHTYILACIHTH